MHKMCLRKKPYTLDMAARIVERRKGGGIRLKSYLCPVCGNHHLARLDISEISGPKSDDPRQQVIHEEFKRLLGIYPQYGNKRLRRMAAVRVATEEKYAQWKAAHCQNPSKKSTNENAERGETEQGSTRSQQTTATRSQDTSEERLNELRSQG